MAEIVVLNGARAGAVFELPDMPTVVGRSPEAHFQLDDPWISSMHAMFERRGPDLWVVDLESRNGTYIGPERVQEALLRPGAVLRFGRTEVRLQLRDPRHRTPPARHPTPPSVPASHPTSRLDAPAVTGGHGLPSPPAPTDPLPLGTRPVALLRMALHLPAAAPAPAAGQLRAAAEALRRAALAMGGLLVGRSGSVLAVFGATHASADDAALALQAAETARREVVALGLSVRAAVDAGTLLVGNVGEGDGFELVALGELADRTERVLALAGPSEILVGPGALAAAEGTDEERVELGGEGLAIARMR